MTTVDTWWAAGELIELDVRDVERRVFVHRSGEGSQMTLLHGFPSSSHDWAKVAPALATRHTLVAPDFLGFGASDKPADHAYSIHEQADLVEALWAHDGTERTVLVGHDYAVSVVQELLARRDEGSLAVELDAVHLLNGGLYPELHRPQPSQTALLDPELGPQIGDLVTEETFVDALRPTFAPGYDAAGDSHAIWRAMSRAGGQRLGYRLIRYITDRAEHRDRWVRALESADLPVSFVWGMLDPVSGAHMAERIRQGRPGSPFLALDDVGHWPPLEAPDRVAGTLLA